jgi:ATP-dependent RNA helicase DDX35
VLSLPRGAPQIIPLALHSGLSTEEQLRVFSRAHPNFRKVVAATNIAEVYSLFDSVVEMQLFPHFTRQVSRLMV